MPYTYTACSCNRVPYCADWGINGLLCFGTRNAVAIYDPSKHIGRVTHTLHLHRDRVNTVHWIKRPRKVHGYHARESELLSGSVDGTVIIWSQTYSDRYDYESKTTYLARTSVLNVGSTVAFADSLQLSDDIDVEFGKLLICTGSINGDIKLWLREEDVKDPKHIQTIDFGRQLPIYCRLTHLPDNKCPLLAVALEDASILLYTTRFDADSKLEPSFVKVQRLIGHEDWVICMDFTQDGDGNLFLATSSKDSTIRLWKISETVEESSSDELKLESNCFTTDDKQYNITLESVLCGHESWVYGVHWQPVESGCGKVNRQTMKLLSCSMDKTMIIWEPAEIMNGIWTEMVRVGEVGGNSLGFYGCKFGPDGTNGQHILAYGYQGSFHIWKWSQERNKWLPHPTPGGHFSEVVDLCWDPKGRFLITASADQTTRIHALWKSDDELHRAWHEIARPQVHGYDMTCLAMLAPHIYASGADEKVVRIFTATFMFRNQLLKLWANVEDFPSIKAHSAAVPSLGLTNKAMYVGENDEDTKNLATGNVYEPPTEEDLMQNTLWPETNKLYGHGYEIFCMAARHDGKLLATACKSTTQEHSAILLWDTDTWLQVQKLVYHQLTVTQMEFSPDDKYLLSVSRDRRWSLFKTTDAHYELIAASSKKDNPHSRIIWCCAWTRDSNYFATGSRDGKIAIWPINTIEDITPKMIIDVQNQSVTALCFAPIVRDRSYFLAIGYETGCIEFRVVCPAVKLDNGQSAVCSRKVKEYDTSQAHHLTVKRLMFRPKTNSSFMFELASCSSDHSVKIHYIQVDL
ncbi:probable elongator complex protein 2 [Temnothorax curvispinosus]|uniref:Elongator complex protein 2 n=1 Tax=Temnothorax curvispinosus TaxID=300111 RepID=A0A6J1PTG5_9HYME|nr:probable elongator complex protein 2 [Temnothorax curvispinosus]